MNSESTDFRFDRSDPVDWDWFAFCYVADELPPEESAWFETRLAESSDQGDAAREAVSQAVELARSIHAAALSSESDDLNELNEHKLNEPASAANSKVQLLPSDGGRSARSGRGASRKMGWMIVAGIAIACTAGWMFLFNDGGGVAMESEDLAAAWVGALEEVDLSLESAELMASESDSGELDSRESESSEDETFADDSDWMFAALIDSTDLDSPDLKEGL